MTRVRCLLLCHARMGAPLPNEMLSAVVIALAHEEARALLANFCRGFVAHATDDDASAVVERPAAARRIFARPVQPPGAAWAPLRSLYDDESDSDGDDVGSNDDADGGPVRTWFACEEVVARADALRRSGAVLRARVCAALRALGRQRSSSSPPPAIEMPRVVQRRLFDTAAEQSSLAAQLADDERAAVQRASAAGSSRWLRLADSDDDDDNDDAPSLFPVAQRGGAT